MSPCDASAERERRVLSHWFPRRPHCCEQVRPPYEKDHGQIWMTIDSPTPPPLSLLLFPEPTVVHCSYCCSRAYCCSYCCSRAYCCSYCCSRAYCCSVVTVNTKNIVQPLTFGCSIFFQTQKHVCFSVFGPASVFFRGGRFFFSRRALYY